MVASVTMCHEITHGGTWPHFCSTLQFGDWYSFCQSNDEGGGAIGAEGRGGLAFEME